MDGASTSSSAHSQEFSLEPHIRYLKRILKVPQRNLRTLDCLKPTILFFANSGLDILNALDSYSEDEKKEMCDWLYSLQITTDDEVDTNKICRCGFRGFSSFPGLDQLLVENNSAADPRTTKGAGAGKYNAAHLAITYSSLCSLIILGDDLSRVNKKCVLNGIKELQSDNGCFTSSVIEGECDMRFLYCACAVCYILDDWSRIDLQAMLKYIVKSLAYDGGFGQGPGMEAHGGSTFCAIASLYMCGKLHSVLTVDQTHSLKRWLVLRQEGGFQGRPNKPPDTCYSFWIGASLKMLDSFNFVNEQRNREYILSTEGSLFGGFAKWPGVEVDLLHTYFGLSGLSLMGEPGLEQMCPCLNITKRAEKRLITLHETWRREKNNTAK